MREAWADTIRSAYMDQVISSERALQVQFTARLMDIFWNNGMNRRVFGEPMMQLESGYRVHPDLLICNINSVISVVELKYQPKKAPNFAKDFETFESLAAEGTNIQIENRRFRGPESGGGRFTLSRDPMYVWAGVYAGPQRDVPGVEPVAFGRAQLLVLHAATRHHEEPELVAVSGRRRTAL
jgi:hypothetical protein